MKSLFRYFALTLSVAIIASGSLFAQIKIERQVIGSGGMVGETNSDNVKMSGILGQSVIETVSRTNDIIVHQGFWAGGDTPVGVEENEDNIAFSSNMTNYPNPMTNSTTIKFTIPISGFVSVKVYDMMGRVVKELVNDVKAAGEQIVEWNGLAGDGQRVPAGTYVYEMTMQSAQAGGTSDVIRDRNMLVVVR